MDDQDIMTIERGKRGSHPCIRHVRLHGRIPRRRFAEMAALLPPPPKVIWTRIGNQPTASIATSLPSCRIDHRAGDDEELCLEIY